MDPTEFENICEEVGADNLYKILSSTVGTERMSNERKYLSKHRAMVVIYIYIYNDVFPVSSSQFIPGHTY